MLRKILREKNVFPVQLFLEKYTSYVNKIQAKYRNLHFINQKSI